MKRNIQDTPNHIRKIVITGYRNMPPHKKMQRVSELNKAVQQLALARIHKQYGAIPEREQQLRLAALWLDRKIMIRIFNWDPYKMGY